MNLCVDGSLRRRAVCTEVLSALDHSGELNALLSDPNGDAAYIERLEVRDRWYEQVLLSDTASVYSV